ncbi:MAG: gamma-glutamyl-gamma-aminobutyrate hydrolase family protein [Planctomycetaceae bacterium]|nr:gamma-glutamyl-gamma-aminobutyrate hydrolase family protein [Planctomycetaceae bacterium]
MPRKPVIGINGDFRDTRQNAAALSWFNTGYYDCITATGAIPYLIPPVQDEEDLKQILSELDGIVLAGCNLDLDPIRLGMDPHPATRVMPKRREDFDRRLAKLAVEMRLPILAIGSGMQTLNVVCGGTLHQHVTENVPGALYHRDGVEMNLRHVIDIVPDTRMFEIYGPGEIRINSHHHMAVAQPADLFMISAICPDGVIEAIESVDPEWFCVGVQWHPENETSSALDMQVFENLYQACLPKEEEVVTTIPFSQAA